MRTYLYAAGGLGLLALVLWAFFLGRHMMVAKCQADTAALKLSYAVALNTALEKQAKDKAKYDAQLEAADHSITILNARLATAGAAPVHHVLCHEAAAGDRGGLPKVPGQAAPDGTGPGAAGNVRGPDFDPAPVQRSLHTAFAAAYAACLDTLNRWPNQEDSHAQP